MLTMLDLLWFIADLIAVTFEFLGWVFDSTSRK